MYSIDCRRTELCSISPLHGLLVLLPQPPCLIRYIEQSGATTPQEHPVHLPRDYDEEIHNIPNVPEVGVFV